MARPAKYAEKRAELLQELCRQGIQNEGVLQAIERTPRELFVPLSIRPWAYDNRALEIAEGQTISQPYIVALMTAALELTGTERVLEIGTGSGYQTAILSRLAQSVHTVERIRSLSLSARSLLDQLGISNVAFRIGDGTHGWPEESPFERMIVTAAGPSVPSQFCDQLTEDGILVMPVGTTEYQTLFAYRKQDGVLKEHKLCSCRFVPLVGTHGWTGIWD